ncbi:MAG: hypothetical protein ACKO71_03180 [Betaproteobacteria bacterium]
MQNASGLKLTPWSALSLRFLIRRVRRWYYERAAMARAALRFD